MNFVGRIYESNNFGKFIILGEIISVFDEWKDRKFKIRFLNTGYETVVSYNAIRHGNVKDKFATTIANVGYIGADIKISDSQYIELYKSWNDMINRCYNRKDNDYYAYGLVGVSVEPAWFSFYNFYQDTILLPGYDNKLKYPNIYQLDKDYLQFKIPKSKRIYSKDTCIWISKYDNIMIMNREKNSRSGYYGVVYKDGGYCTVINGKCFGKFTIPEAAANLFNYIYPNYRNQFSNIIILNNVPKMTKNELQKYYIPKFHTSKKYYVGSTTIPVKGGEIPQQE